jgi:tRNA (guanine-N7-)-methyltransferase
VQNSLQELPKLSSLTLPWPTDWTAVFGVERRLILEIGFGYGHFLHHLHQTRPDANIIGLEVNNTCLVKAEKAIPRKGMHNVRVVRSSAETALHHLFTPNSIQEIHINFPDPWFKDRHAGRRLMQRDTLDAMTSRLHPGGMLYLATDIRDYAEMSADLLESTLGLTNTFDTGWVHSMPGRVITKYERKAQQAGRPCFYFAYRRNDQPVQHPPAIKEQPMPHMIIQSPLTLQQMFAALEESDLTEVTVESGEARVNFKNSYLGSHSLLFDAYVHEPTIDQRVSLALVERQQHPGEYTLKLGAIGSPRPTDGIHAAVRYLGERLLALDAESVVIQDKVRS